MGIPTYYYDVVPTTGEAIVCEATVYAEEHGASITRIHRLGRPGEDYRGRLTFKDRAILAGRAYRRATDEVEFQASEADDLRYEAGRA